MLWKEQKIRSKLYMAKYSLYKSKHNLDKMRAAPLTAQSVARYKHYADNAFEDIQSILEGAWYDR